MTYHLIKRVVFLWLLSLGVCRLGFADDSLEIHAYYRSGVGFSDGLTEGVCYQTPGWPSAVPRFGNECGQYSEIIMTKNYKPGKIQYKGHFTLSYSSDGNETYESTANGDLQAAHREAFIEAIGVLGKKTSIWVGKRYYQRYYIEMWDYFLVDHNGSGFGFENMDLEFGDLHMALFRHFTTEADSPLHTSTDTRFSDIKMLGGNLGLRHIYGILGNKGRSSGDDLWHKVDGHQLTVDYASSGRNWKYHTYLQYGLGLYGGRPDTGVGFQTGSTLNQYTPSAFSKADGIASEEKAQAWQDSSTTNWIHHLTLEPYGGISSWDIALLWSQVDFGGRVDDNGTTVPRRTTLAFGVRPAIFLTDFWAVDADLYFASIDNGSPFNPFEGAGTPGTDYIERSLTKASVGLVIRPAPIYSAKPQIRFYATHAQWNEEQKGDQLVTANGSRVYADRTSGFTFGVQGEVWW